MEKTAAPQTSHVYACQPVWQPDQTGQKLLATYLGRHGKLRHIDVRPITEPEGDVVGYAIKHVARNPTSVDDVLILPKAASELIPRSELRRG